MYYSYEDILKISQENNIILSHDVLDIIESIKKSIFKDEYFKITTINKQKDNCGIICKSLNKLSDKNYPKIKEEIFLMIDDIDNENEINIISDRIFDIASSNMFLSSIFSRLYKELIEKNASFYNVFEKNYNNYCNSFNDINYVSNTINYDEYCNYTKQMDKIKSGFVFFINLMKQDITTPDKIIFLCNELIHKIKKELEHKENQEYKEELIKSIYIIISESYDYIYKEPLWKNICDSITFIQKHPNNTPKIRFKCMDINDFIKKQLNK